MEENKKKYLNALASANNTIGEIELGQALGFSNKQTEEIIADLEKEGKIEFQSIGICSYKIV